MKKSIALLAVWLVLSSQAFGAQKINVDEFFVKQKELAGKLFEAQKKYQKVLISKASASSGEKQRSLLWAAAYFLGASSTCVGMLGDVLKFYQLTPDTGKNFKEYSNLFAQDLLGSAAMLEQTAGFVEAAMKESGDKDVKEALGTLPSDIAELISYLRDKGAAAGNLEETPAKTQRKSK